MSASIALSSVTMAGPGTTRPALSQLVTTNSSRNRSVWRSARNYHSIREKMERIAQSIDKTQRHPQANLRRKKEACNGWPATAHRDPSSSKGWTTHWPRSSRFSELAGREKTYWDAELEQMNHRIAHLKRQVARDPYEAIFGRRVHSSHYLDQSDTATTWPGFLRTFFGAEKPRTEHPSKAHLQNFNFTQSPVQSRASNGRDTLEYDPISGRMAPKAPKPKQQTESEQMHSSNAGVDCPPGSEAEVKMSSNPSIVEDGQFQPGSVFPGKTNTLKSQTIDCPPGSGLETLFTSDSASYKSTQTGAGLPNESAHKPDIHVACTPGSELEALFIPESIPSKEARADTLKVRAKPKTLSAGAGLGSGQNVECATGSELDALIAANHATRNDTSRPPEEFGLQFSTNVSMDCTPGNELEAKFASEFNSRSQSKKESSSVDCSLDSELEASIVAETTRAQLSDPAIDCTPGSELEALFTTNPATIQASHYAPPRPTSDAEVKKANVTVDCAPGNELTAEVLSDAASTEIRGQSEDLTSLDASDIRARYTSLKSDGTPSSESKTVNFDTSKDRVSDFLQSQNTPSTTQQWSQAEYRILAHDTTAATVTTAESDSFFGVCEPVQPHEILSRLHNPAKFVPYFAQMQQDGYEIATGGGDILVFKRSAKKINHIPAAIQQDYIPEDVQADIARYRNHDSYDSTDYVRHYHPSSTTKPSTSGHSTSTFSASPSSTSNSNFDSGSGNTTGADSNSTLKSNSHAKQNPKSTFRKVLRRIILTGTITAGSCYAIGVVTEYFRTGGIDGYGVDGFTTFESDRRHRE